MSFAIISSSGNVLEWFDDASSARAALDSMLAEFPGAQGRVDLMSFDDSGLLVGESDATATRRFWIDWASSLIPVVATGGGLSAVVKSQDLGSRPENSTDDLVLAPA